jgi:hypothetical protein
MRNRKRSLADYLAAELPLELRGAGRPSDDEENREFMSRRLAWCKAHGITALQLIRYDRDVMRAEMGLPPQPRPRNQPRRSTP